LRHVKKSRTGSRVNTTEKEDSSNRNQKIDPTALGRDRKLPERGKAGVQLRRSASTEHAKERRGVQTNTIKFATDETIGAVRLESRLNRNGKQTYGVAITLESSSRKPKKNNPGFSPAGGHGVGEEGKKRT